jgi:Tfp pilus assembly protein PilN
MYQQINLYQPVFRRQRKVFSAATLLQIIVIAAVLLLGFFVHAQWTMNGLDSTVASLSTQYQQLEARLGILENAGSDGGFDVPGEVARLQQTLRERQALLDSFTRLDFRENIAFSEFFETLARRTLPGLWLTGISLTEDGETELRGSTLNPTLVPRYLQAMPDQPRFIALHQGSVHLSRADPKKPAVTFKLSSNAGEEL